MSIIRAIFENGVFRPTEDVDLPERTEVEFAPTIVASPANETDIAATADLNQFSGTLRLREDPLSYQDRVRNEWP